MLVDRSRVGSALLASYLWLLQPGCSASDGNSSEPTQDASNPASGTEQDAQVADAGAQGAQDGGGDATTDNPPESCPDAACGAPLDPLPSCQEGQNAVVTCVRQGDGVCNWSAACEADDTPPIDPGSGAFCGGFAGIECEDPKEYCNYPSGCGASDEGGKCATRPKACDLNYMPVCGCDGQTYGNACAAAGAGVSVAKSGECDAP